MLDGEVAGKETRNRLPKGVAGPAVSHFAGENEEELIVLKVIEDGGAEDDEGALLSAEGVGIPHLIAGDIDIGHVGEAEEARSQDGSIPDVGKLARAESNAVEGGLDPRAADLVRDGANGGVEGGDSLQLVHRLTVLGPEEGGAIELVAGEEGTEPTTVGADIVCAAQASAIAAA